MQFPSKKGLRPDHSVGHVHTIAEPKRPEPDARPEVHFGGSPPLLLLLAMAATKVTIRQENEKN